MEKASFKISLYSSPWKHAVRNKPGRIGRSALSSSSVFSKFTGAMNETLPDWCVFQTDDCFEQLKHVLIRDGSYLILFTLSLPISSVFILQQNHALCLRWEGLCVNFVISHSSWAQYLPMESYQSLLTC